MKSIGKNNSLSITQWVLLLLIPIFMRGCFWYVGIPNGLEKMLAFITAVLLLLFFCLKIVPKKLSKYSYGRLIKTIILLSFVSIINAYFYWGQSPVLTFSAGFGIYIYIYYFVLQKICPNEEQILKLVFIISCIYGVLWMYALSMAPQTVFGNKEQIDDTRGIFRIVLECLDAVGLLYFYSLTKYLSNIKKVKYLVFAIISFLLLFVTLSRMVILSVTVVTFFYVIRKQSIKTILIVSLLIVLGWGSVMQNKIVKNLIELQERQSDDTNGDRLIRNEYTDCFNLFPFNVGTFLFGNGSEHTTSSYGNREEKLKKDYDFNRSDAGYPGYYVTYGFVSFIIMMLLLVKVLKEKVPDDCYYCKLYILYFIIASVTTNYFEREGLALMIVFYVLDRIKYMDNRFITKMQ